MKGGKSRAESKKAEAKLSVKKGAPAKGGKKTKAVKDPNKPKRAPSAFFVFMSEFREGYKKKHPNNKSVAAAYTHFRLGGPRKQPPFHSEGVGKAAGEKWKSLSEEEKAPYVEKAETLKTEYEKNMKNYNKKLAEGHKHDEEEDESDKSRSEINNEDEEDSEEEDEDDD